jgi:hypothetical protein
MATLDLIREAMAVLEVEDAKFVKGNSSAGTRARKALVDIAKLAKARRGEISAEKAVRKEAKSED